MKLSVPDNYVPSASKFNNGHWKFDQQMGKGAGFVYIIRDNLMEKFYLGKKSFRVSSGYETNWRKYTSSSNILNSLLEAGDKSDFDFFCLEQYRMTGTVSYAETWSLCLVEAPTTDRWYNKRIEKVAWNVSEKLSEKHKRRLNIIINMGDPDA